MLITAIAILQGNEHLVADVVEMDLFSWVFMLTSMGAVTALAVWCFTRILTGKAHFDPDGTGPARAPVKGEADPDV